MGKLKKVMEFPYLNGILMLIILIAQLVLLDSIKSCTSPRGSCYRRAQANQVRIVGNLNDVTVFAAFCAARIPPPVSTEEVQKCIDSEMTAKGQR